MPKNDGHNSPTDNSVRNSYWESRLVHLPVTEIASDFPRPPSQAFSRDVASRDLPEELICALRVFCRQNEIDLFAVFCLALKILILRHTGQTDLVVGSLAAKCSIGEGALEWVNPVPLRTTLTPELSVGEALDRVSNTIGDAADHCDTPFAELAAALAPTDFARSPLFQIMLVAQDEPTSLSAVAIGEAGLDRVAEHIVRCDVLILMSTSDDGIRLACEFDSDLFEPSTVRRILGHLGTLLGELCHDLDQPLSDLPVATEEERYQLLVEWNATPRDYPREPCLHHLFEAQAAKTPETTAVVFEGQALTYAQLNHRANQLAHLLRRFGVGPEFLVGVFMERSLEMVVALYGIIKAGGAYVPLDPDYPAERIAFMLDDADVTVLLTQEALAGTLPICDAEVICLDTAWSCIEEESPVNPDVPMTADDLAYVIFTSGSTGRPKGVMNSHRGICNRLFWGQEAFGLTVEDCVLQKTPFSFDVSVWEFFWPLQTGARLVIAAPGAHRDAAALIGLISDQAVTTLHFVPSMLQLFLEEEGLDRCHRLRRVICSGEALSYDVQEHFFSRLDAELHNLYGPTEAAVEVSHWPCQRNSNRPVVPIGKPIANTQLYVLGPNLMPEPIGVPGELHIGGVQVARGYLKRPERTAERFIPDPFSKHPGARLYKTGDLGRYLSDGSIEYLGRIDHQVKIRGLRVELGEIEAMLAEHPDVRECVVVMREVGPSDQRLVAYLVPNRPDGTVAEAVKKHLARMLPAYMVPAHIVQLNAMPLSPNGKIDRMALADQLVPEPAPSLGNEQARSEIEAALVEIWREVLRIDAVGTHDNFFDLGGHSLLLAEVNARLKERFACDLSITEMFRLPTIELLAKQIAGGVPVGMTAETKARNVDVSSDIAIIGLSCRLPGAGNAEKFWQDILGGVESIEFFSDEALLAEGIARDLLAKPNYVKARAVLPDVDLFDADFFGYSPREAELLDPQQRLFLEIAWEALENAGYAPDGNQVPVGVFAGAGMNTYLINNLNGTTQSGGPVGAFQLMIANDKDFLPTRVSYKLDLKGPSINIQTACSTSLVAVHMACRALHQGDCKMAISGGISIHLPQVCGYEYQEGMIFSADGHCRSFDAKANGTVFGSGAAAVVLKRLADAYADGDQVRAVIKGSAINNDGSLKIGYTAPSIEGQEAVISQAQAEAGVHADSITYVEAHGTATALGDPIEIEALTRAFRRTTDKNGFCGIGSVKTNIGHVDAAAGVAGLIKTVLALEHKQLPPSLHFEEANPQIDFGQSPFFVVKEAIDWPADSTPRRAGVSSFGIGGTNAHVVLEEAPAVERAASTMERDYHLLTLSGKNSEALRDLAGRYLVALGETPAADLGDFCFTANAGRSQFSECIAVLGSDGQELRAGLEGFLEDSNAGAAWHGRVGSVAPGRVAFLFTGQGAQRAGMGRSLYESSPVFRRALDRCDEILRPELGGSVVSVMQGGDAALLQETAWTQPALFSLEYALSELWRSWGLEPGAVLGHSVGEYVAACVAGVFGLEDGLKLVAARGRLMQALPREGAMYAVLAGEAAVLSALARYEAEVSLAAVNGPRSCVISGRSAALEAVVSALAETGIESRPLSVSHAFHSPLMAPMVSAFAEVAETVAYQESALTLISNETGAAAGPEVAGADYWCRQILAPVRFQAGMAALAAAGYETFLELGPQPTLLSLGRSCLKGPGLTWLPSLRRGVADWRQMLESLARLYLQGREVDWAAFDAPYGRRRRALPTYPFQRERYWVETSAAKSTPPINQTLQHPLLGRRIVLPMSEETRFETVLSRHSPAYVEDHRIFGHLVVAGASHVAMILEGARAMLDRDACVLEEIFFLKPFSLSDEVQRPAQLIFAPANDGCSTFQLVSLREGAEASAGDAWILHASGKLGLPASKPAEEVFPLSAARARCKRRMSGAEFYERFWAQGKDAGPCFRFIDEIWMGADEALCRTRCPDTVEGTDDYQLYPGIIEACFQVLRGAREFESADLLARGGHFYVPASIDRFEFYHRPSADRLWCYARIREGSTEENVEGDLQLLDERGLPLAQIIGFNVRCLSKPTLRQSLQTDVRTRLAEAEAESRQGLLITYLQEVVRKIAGLSSSQIPDPLLPLSELGLDSLMYTELRNTIVTDLKLNISITGIMSGATILELSKLVFPQLVIDLLSDSSDDASSDDKEGMEQLIL